MNQKENQGKDKIKASFQSKAFHVGSYSTFASIAVIAIAIVVILLVEQLPAKFTQLDVTANGLYSISDQTKQIVSAVDQDVTIYHIVQTGNEDASIENMLNRYADLSDKVKVEKKDPVTYPGFAKKYTNQQVTENSLVVECGAKNRFISYSDIYKVQYDYSTGSAQSADFDGENLLTGAINYVSSEDAPKLYMLTGHGEQSLPQTITDSIQNENYETKELSLMTQNAVPDDAAALIVNSPSSDLSAEEKDSILNYMQAGGSLLLITDYSENETPNLDALTAYYGAQRTGAMVFDPDGSHSLRGKYYYLLPNIGSHEITEPLQDRYVLLPMAEGLKTKEDKRDGLTVTELLTTSYSAYGKTAVNEGASVEKADGDLDGPFAVGIASEEVIGGAEKEETQASEEGEEAGEAEEEKEPENTARFVWLSTGMALQEQVNQLVSGGNSDLFMNAVGWMCQNEDMISIRAKSMDMENLTVPSGRASLWGVITIGLIPLAFVIAGVYIWIRRRRKV